MVTRRGPRRLALLSAAPLVALLGLALLVVPRPVLAQEARTIVTEQQVKAAFLYNFAKFVTWPGPATTDSLVIGAVGGGAVADVLRASVQGRVVKGRPVAVRLFHGPAEIGPCDILYVGFTEPDRVDALLRGHTHPGVLTVGETDRFLDAGGTISFVIRDSRVGFIVNVGAVAQNGLEVSSGMLKVAQGVVNTTPAGGRK